MLCDTCKDALGSPAGAGIDHYPLYWRTFCQRFPRRRGDRPMSGVNPLSFPEVPPQARG